jgi:hypothetical protein
MAVGLGFATRPEDRSRRRHRRLHDLCALSSAFPIFLFARKQQAAACAVAHGSECRQRFYMKAMSFAMAVHGTEATKSPGITLIRD